MFNVVGQKINMPCSNCCFGLGVWSLFILVLLFPTVYSRGRFTCRQDNRPYAALWLAAGLWRHAQRKKNTELLAAGGTRVCVCAPRKKVRSVTAVNSGKNPDDTLLQSKLGPSSVALWLFLDAFNWWFLTRGPSLRDRVSSRSSQDELRSGGRETSSLCKWTTFSGWICVVAGGKTRVRGWFTHWPLGCFLSAHRRDRETGEPVVQAASRG